MRNIQRLLSIDAMAALSLKFKKEANSSNCSEEMAYFYKNEIQRIINSIDSIEYSDKSSADRIKKPINDYFENRLNDKRTFVRIPFESEDKKVRREAFMNRVKRGACGNLYEVESFLYQEIFGANKQIMEDIRESKKSSIDDYIDNILNAIRNTKETVKGRIDLKKINQKRFRLRFSKEPGWESYDNLFQAYLAKEYVPEKSVTEWMKVAEFYQFDIQ